VKQLAPAGRPLEQLAAESRIVRPRVSEVVIVIVVEVEVPAVTVTVLGEGEIVTEGIAQTGFTKPTKHTKNNTATNRKALLKHTQPVRHRLELI
jgi:hypothetical protein